MTPIVQSDRAILPSQYSPYQVSFVITLIICFINSTKLTLTRLISVSFEHKTMI